MSTLRPPKPHLLTVWVKIAAANSRWTYPDEGELRRAGERILGTLAGKSDLQGTSVVVGGVELSYELRVGNDRDDRGDLVLYVEASARGDWTDIAVRALRLLSAEGYAIQFMINEGVKEDPDRVFFVEFSGSELDF